MNHANSSGSRAVAALAMRNGKYTRNVQYRHIDHQCPRPGTAAANAVYDTLRDWTRYLVRLKVFASALRIDFIYNMTCGKGGFEVLGVSHVLRTKEMAFDVMNGYTMTFILNSASYNWKKATCARL